MAFVRLKGLNSVRKRRADGTVAVYWYAWKGGPKIDTTAAPGTPAFIAAYNTAVADARPQPKDTLAGLVGRYRASPEFTGNADTTRAEWARYLKLIEADAGPLDIGGLTLKALDDRRVRADLLEWRDQWSGTPRKADYAIQVLGRVLAWGMDRGHLALNAAAGVAQLYESDRADQIWTPEEIAAFVAAAPSAEVGFVVPLACLTGLRRTDLTKLSDAHVGDAAIVFRTGKSRGRRTIVVPILPETRELLAEIRQQRDRRHAQLCATAAKKGRPAPPRPTTLLSNTRGRPWSPSGLEHQVIDTKAKAQVGHNKAPIDKHLHDARGTFGTRLRKAGLKASQIADVLGWTEARVERLLKTYVDQDAIILDIAAQIARAEKDR